MCVCLLRGLHASLMCIYLIRGLHASLMCVCLLRGFAGNRAAASAPRQATKTSHQDTPPRQAALDAQGTHQAHTMSPLTTCLLRTTHLRRILTKLTRRGKLAGTDIERLTDLRRMERRTQVLCTGTTVGTYSSFVPLYKRPLHCSLHCSP